MRGRGQTAELGTAALVTALLVILAIALWYAAGAWLAVAGPPMPFSGYLAMVLGIVVSLIVGCGLMALSFYSSRHGYDEPLPRALLTNKRSLLSRLNRQFCDGCQPDLNFYRLQG